MSDKVVYEQIAWISCKDALPEQWQEEKGKVLKNYLVIMPEHGIDIGNFLRPAGKWICMGIPVKVTHWAELPKGPEEERDENTPCINKHRRFGETSEKRVKPFS